MKKIPVYFLTIPGPFSRQVPTFRQGDLVVGFIYSKFDFDFKNTELGGVITIHKTVKTDDEAETSEIDVCLDAYQAMISVALGSHGLTYTQAAQDRPDLDPGHWYGT